MVLKRSDQNACSRKSLIRSPLCLESLIRGILGLESLIKVIFRLESLRKDYIGLESLIRRQFGSGQPGQCPKHYLQNCFSRIVAEILCSS